MRVLVVEDEAKLASLLRQGLRRRGMGVDLAGTGEEAVMRATTTDYDAFSPWAMEYRPEYFADPRSGTERGFVCTEHKDAVIGTLEWVKAKPVVR